MHARKGLKFQQKLEKNFNVCFFSTSLYRTLEMEQEKKGQDLGMADGEDIVGEPVAVWSDEHDDDLNSNLNQERDFLDVYTENEALKIENVELKRQLEMYESREKIKEAELRRAMMVFISSILFNQVMVMV